MKRLILFLITAISFEYMAAQNNAAQPPYLRFPTIPPLKLLKVDSATYLTKDDIKKNHRTIIMYFSPECEHCKHQTESILGSMDQFKDIEIVMATLLPFHEMKDFYEYYRIADHPNIKMGWDQTATLRGFYSTMQSLPYLALYDKKGNLITTFEGSQKVSTILDAFNKGKE
ncbi:MAG TPA: hypothetical protein VMH01_06885 [Puia sp.]|nr:hypothetical protein [Puia sp.]